MQPGVTHAARSRNLPPMYPGQHAIDHPDRPVVIMAGSGLTITYREYEAKANQIAHLFRSIGLVRGDHIAILMENNPAMLLVEAAAERCGLFFTCLNSYLTGPESAYIVNDSQSKVFVSSNAKAASALEEIGRASCRERV